MGSRFLIYALIDPRTQAVRYVGKSSNALHRPRVHAKDAANGKKTHLANWIRQLQGIGIKYDIWVLEELPTEDGLNAREVWWIAFAWSWGCKLTNLTVGGVGTTGWVPTEETRAHWRAAQALPEVKARVSAGVRAALARPGVRERLRAAVIEAQKCPEVHQHISEGTRAALADVAVREKMRTASRTRMEEPGRRARLSVTVRNAYTDPALRAKVGAAVSKALSDPDTRARKIAGHLASWARRKATLGTEEINRRAHEAANRPEVREKKRATMRARPVLAVQWGPM